MGIKCPLKSRVLLPIWGRRVQPEITSVGSISCGLILIHVSPYGLRAMDDDLINAYAFGNFHKALLLVSYGDMIAREQHPGHAL
jgi:hypothetical protein